MLEGLAVLMRAVAAAFALVLLVLASGCVAPAGIGLSSAPQDALEALAPFRAAVKVGEQGNEPVIRVAPDGTVYIAALQYLYVSRDNGTTFKPADFKGQLPVYASDSALAVAPDGRVYIAFDWPYAGHTAVCTSARAGQPFSCVPVAVPGFTDRMWILAPTAKDVYLITGQTLDRPTFATSHDAGQTWTITYYDWTYEAQGEDLVWDPIAKEIVEAASSPAGPGWGVRTFKPDGSFIGFRKLDLPEPPAQSLNIDAAGTWWAVTCTSNEPPCLPAVARSDDRGGSWTVAPIPFAGKTWLLPFLTAGAAGRVALAWYETNASSADDASAQWRVSIARTSDGATWATQTLTDQPVHTGAMCKAVNCLGDNRYAGDFLGLAFDANGDTHATWIRQDRARDLPTSQLNPSGSWVHIEYARSG